jgi:hypothetical protein
MVKPVFGTCHICGEHKKLSFEHVPPKAAFNRFPILRSSFEKIAMSENLDELQGKVQQRGSGAYTLCEKCNSDTGAWYADAYARWAEQAMRLLMAARGRPSLEYPFHLHPLRVLKQVVCMFFSVNNPLFQKANPNLVRFVLNRDSQQFPPGVRIYAFYTFSNRMRSSGASGMVRGMGSGNSVLHAFSEIAFAPFGFVMTLGDTSPPQPHFLDISSFAQFGYRDWRAGISIKLPVMPIYTAFPGDYRTRSQTLADFEANKAYEASLRTTGGVTP